MVDMMFPASAGRSLRNAWYEYWWRGFTLIFCSDDGQQRILCK